MRDEPRSFATPETVDLDDDASVQACAERLDAKPEDVRAAAQAVGPNLTAIELWLDAPAD